MKINNEYVSKNNFTENIFTEDINKISTEKDVMPNAVQSVKITKGESYDNAEKYNKYGEREEVEEKTFENDKAFDIASLQESLKNVIGEMDGSDYERLQKWGMAPADEDTEAVVTVYERIQIQLMTYCDDYNATGLNIDKEKMAKVLGSVPMAEAVSKVSDLDKFTDDTKEYMIKNNIEPTVDNVYMSMHSCGKKTVPALKDEAVINAVKDKFTKEGYELNETNIKNGMWLVTRGIEVNSKNMNRLAELNQIDQLKSGDEEALALLSQNIAYSMYAGKSSGNAYITDRYVNADGVEEVVEAVNNATDEDLAYIAVNNLPLNAANLMNARAVNESASKAVTSAKLQVVEFKQIIFEARIVMTQASVFNLKRLGVDINYTDIAQMTENIIDERNKIIDKMFENAGFEATANEKNIITDLYYVMNSMTSLPRDVICKVHTEEISFTMASVHESGMDLKNQYEAAMISYETLGTEVRRDLGDSYAKAFSNVDNLLNEIGMEINSANQRAVRILGYNSMEITVENVTGVKEIATELDYLIDNMTPKTAIHLIKEGINPLEDNIRDVNRMLENINEKLGKEDEQMGKFLWNLEKKGEVTEKEKSDYIELYRILNMISKNDGNVIGRVLSEGRELTLKNLYSAYKSKKAGDFDYSLSDEYKISYVRKSITTFMEKPEAVASVVENGEPKDISVERMIDMANEYMAEEDYSYYENEMKKYEEILDVSKNELEQIVRQLDSQSISNIAAYMEVNNAKSFMKKIKEYDEVSEVIREVEAELEGDGDIAELNQKYEKLQAAGKEALEYVKEKSDLSYGKLQGALLMTKTLSMMNSYAKKNSYFVPMELGGEVTNVHLTINHKADMADNVTISMSSELLGSVTSIFTIKSTKVMGRIVSDNEETVKMIGENMSIFSKSVGAVGIETGEIQCYRSINEASYKYDVSSDENVGTNTYYTVAKAFIGMIKIASKVK